MTVKVKSLDVRRMETLVRTTLAVICIAGAVCAISVADWDGWVSTSGTAIVVIVLIVLAIGHCRSSAVAAKVSAVVGALALVALVPHALGVYSAFDAARPGCDTSQVIGFAALWLFAVLSVVNYLVMAASGALKSGEALPVDGRNLSLGERWERWLCARTVRMQRDAMEVRPSLSRGEFTQCFPDEQREAGAIWDALGQQIFVDGFLPHPDDDLETIYDLFDEELEDVLKEALDAVGYRIPPSPKTIVVPPVKTVRDAVQCVARFRPSFA